MRLVERFSIIVFSIFILVLSCFTILVSTNLVDVDIWNDIFDFLSENIVATICICILLIIWSLANIFFKSDSKSDNINGVLLENESGSLLITRDSISNLVETVLKRSNDLKTESVKIGFDENKDVIINVIISVKDNTVIKEISAKLQENIKLAIKRATDLETKEINIKVKGVEQEKNIQNA